MKFKYVAKYSRTTFCQLSDISVNQMLNNKCVLSCDTSCDIWHSEKFRKWFSRLASLSSQFYLRATLSADEFMRLYILWNSGHCSPHVRLFEWSSWSGATLTAYVRKIPFRLTRHIYNCLMIVRAMSLLCYYLLYVHTCNCLIR